MGTRRYVHIVCVQIVVKATKKRFMTFILEFDMENKITVSVRSAVAVTFTLCCSYYSYSYIKDT